MQKAIKDNKGKYQNPVPTQMGGFSMMPKILKRYFSADNSLRKPPFPIPVIPIKGKIFWQKPSEELVVYWMGHSSIIMEIAHRRYLLDPVLSERASMFDNYGPKRLHPAPISVNQIQNIDAVILSHDHYDHMDIHVMKALSKSNTKFYVPLGVGAILKKWGCIPENISEFNWWDEIIDGINTIVALPARHFSGRGITHRNETLWCSWAIINEKQRVYFGGDSGIMPQYKDIGDKFGPFDLTIMPIGAYDELWHDIHLFPKETVEAQLMLKSKKMLPVHWATFDLALHPWGEPIEQLLIEADKHGIEVLTPKVGEKINPATHISETWFGNRGYYP